jgi:hypothetical protein
MHIDCDVLLRRDLQSIRTILLVMVMVMVMVMVILKMFEFCHTSSKSQSEGSTTLPATVVVQ